MSSEPEARVCQECGDILLGQKRTYCSAACQKAKVRNKYLLETYGITSAQWEEVFDFQGRKCAICHAEPGGRRVFVLDHEHDGGPAGRIRGILCGNCNLRIIGKHKRGDLLKRAGEYLDSPPALKVLGTIIAPGRKKRKRQPRKRRRAS